MAQENDIFSSSDIFSPEDLTKYPVTLGEGGGIVSLPPYVVSETGLGQGTFGDLFGAQSAGVTVPFTPPQSNVGGGGALVNRMPVAQPLEGNDIYTQIYNQELARRNAIRQAKGDLPIAAYDTAEIGQLADWAKGQVEAANQQQQADAALAARNAAASSGQLGIPLVLPLPVDPITGLAITTAGLIASRGNIAKLDPTNPVGSLVGAAEGTINTIGSIPGQIAGAVGMGSTTGTQTGAEGTGTGTGGEAGGTGTEGTIIVPPGAIGGNSGNTGTTPSDTGTSSTGGSTPVIVGGGGTTTTTTSTQTQTQPSDNEFWNKVLGGVASTQQTNQPPSERVGGLTGTISQTGSTTVTGGGSTRTSTDTGGGGSSSTGVVGGGGGGTTSGGADTRTGGGGSSTGVVGGGGTGGGGTTGGGRTGGEGGGGGTPGATGTGGGGAGAGGAGSFPIVYGTQTSSYTPMATTVYQRNLPKELSQSTSALFGQIPLVNAQGQPTGGTTTLMGQYGDIYQNLLGQTMLGNAQQPGLTAQLGQQLSADQAKLQRIQQGQLAAEDVRNAQQAAREAYGARGQVMGQGAIGAEILNREAIRQQRENEARAAYNTSVQNALSATNLQTGNIFQPVGSLISGTFNPLAPYEADVYGTNVNALNADQIAQANRQAALEAAKLGQTGTYAQALGTFLGSPTGQAGVTSLIDMLLGRGRTPGT